MHKRMAVGTMRLQRFGLYFGLVLLLLLVGCGGGGDPRSKAYTLRFIWSNTSANSVYLLGADTLAEKDTGPVAVPSHNAASFSTTAGTYFDDPYTNITVSVSSASGAPISHVDINGVHIGEDQISYIYVTYDGSRLTVDATHNAGVP